MLTVQAKPVASSQLPESRRYGRSNNCANVSMPGRIEGRPSGTGSSSTRSRGSRPRSVSARRRSRSPGCAAGPRSPRRSSAPARSSSCAPTWPRWRSPSRLSSHLQCGIRSSHAESGHIGSSSRRERRSRGHVPSASQRERLRTPETCGRASGDRKTESGSGCRPW
jgi:hypothetical protein